MIRNARILLVIVLLGLQLPVHAAPATSALFQVAAAAPADALQLDLRLAPEQMEAGVALVQLKLTAQVALRELTVTWEPRASVTPAADAPQSAVALPAGESAEWTYRVPISGEGCGSFSLFAAAHTLEADAPVSARLRGSLSRDGGGLKLLLDPPAPVAASPALPPTGVQGGGGGDPYEPDDTSAGARLVTVGTLYPGYRFDYPSDADWIKFAATSGKSYAIELLNQGCLCQPELDLYGTDATTLIHPEPYRGSILWTATASGLYYVKVRSLDPAGYGANTAFSLRVRAFSNPPDAYEPDDSWASARPASLGASYYHTFHAWNDSDIVKFKGLAGHSYRADILSPGPLAHPRMQVYREDGPGDPTLIVSGNGHVTWQASLTAVYYVAVVNDSAYTLGDYFGPKAYYSLRVGSFAPAQDAYEPDGTPLPAKIPSLGVAYRHNASTADDEDWMQFFGFAGTPYAIEIPYWGKYAAGNWTLYLYQNDAVTEIQHTDGRGLDFTPSGSGWYYVRLRHHPLAPFGPGSEYDVRIAGPDPYESDDSWSAATPLAIGALSPAHNIHPKTEEDWFSFSAVAGKSYLIQALKRESSMTANLSVFGASGTGPLLSQDNRLTWRAPDSGTYYVRVGSSGPGAYLTGYRLLVQTFTPAPDAFEPDNDLPHARPMALGTIYGHTLSRPGSNHDDDSMRFQATAGAYYKIRLRTTVAYGEPRLVPGDKYGDPVFPDIYDGSVSLGWRAPSSDAYYLAVNNVGGATFGPGTNYTLQVTKYTPNIDAFEGTSGDNDPAHASWFTLGTFQHHTFHVSYDYDWVKVNLTSGHAYRFETVNLGCSNDTVLFLFRPGGASQIAYDDDDGYWAASLLEWTADATDTFYVEVIRFGGLGYGPGTDYDLHIAEITP